MGQSKAVLRRKFIAIQANLRKIETFQLKKLTLYLQELEEQQQTKPRVNRRKEIRKSRAELSDIQTKRTILRISKSRRWLFVTINKIDKPLSRFIKRTRERMKINTSSNKRGDITTDTTEIQRIVRNYYKEHYSRKFENLHEMDRFL